MKALARILALVVFGLGAAEPPPPAAPAPAPTGIRKTVVACHLCKGTGRLRLHPPDHGQNQGSIHSKDYWDVKRACPLCQGRGRRTVFVTRFTRTFPDIPPCRSCGWSGVEPCRACQATGLEKCTARECRDGWNVRKVEVGKGRMNRNFRMSVEPCPTCGGVGRVPCRACRGMEGKPCRACSGMGRKVR